MSATGNKVTETNEEWRQWTAEAHEFIDDLLLTAHKERPGLVDAARSVLRAAAEAKALATLLPPCRRCSGTGKSALPGYDDAWDELDRIALKLVELKKAAEPEAKVEHVTDAMQGVDCWRCEEDVPHTHGPIVAKAEPEACTCEPTTLVRHDAGCTIGWPPTPPGGCETCRGTGGFVATPSGARPARRWDRPCTDCNMTGKALP